MCCKCHIHSKFIAFPRTVLMYEHPTILENLFIRLQCYTIKNLLHVVQKRAVKNLSDEGILSSCVVLTGDQTSPKQPIDTN